MKFLVVYESMFGDTRLIAEAIGVGLSANSASNNVEVVEVGVAPTSVDTDLDLLVVGGPTHAFSMSRPSSRQNARSMAGREIISGRRGIREWLDIAEFLPDLAAATFDTKVSKPHLPGSAGRAAQRRLRRKGCRIIAPAENFFVADTKGPLNDGEEIKARSWGADLESLVSATPRTDPLDDGVDQSSRSRPGRHEEPTSGSAPVQAEDRQPGRHLR